jgi:hypothetical protein
MVAGIAGGLLVRFHDEAITGATSIPTAKSKIKYPVLLTYATAGRFLISTTVHGRPAVLPFDPG